MWEGCTVSARQDTGRCHDILTMHVMKHHEIMKPMAGMDCPRSGAAPEAKTQRQGRCQPGAGLFVVLAVFEVGIGHPSHMI